MIIFLFRAKLFSAAHFTVNKTRDISKHLKVTKFIGAKFYLKLLQLLLLPISKPRHTYVGTLLIPWKMHPSGPKSFIQNDESRKWMFPRIFVLPVKSFSFMPAFSSLVLMFVSRTTRVRRLVRIQDIQSKCCYGSNPLLFECKGHPFSFQFVAIMRRVIEKIFLSDRCFPPSVSATKR
jgi:hypothetical protein